MFLKQYAYKSKTTFSKVFVFWILLTLLFNHNILLNLLYYSFRSEIVKFNWYEQHIKIRKIHDHQSVINNGL